jgi:hypothetical protein
MELREKTVMASITVKTGGSHQLQWGEQVFDTLPVLQVSLPTKHVEVCNFSTVRDRI